MRLTEPGCPQSAAHGLTVAVLKRPVLWLGKRAVHDPVKRHCTLLEDEKHPSTWISTSTAAVLILAAFLRRAATCYPRVDPGWPFVIVLVPAAEADGPTVCANLGGRYPDIDTIYSNGEDMFAPSMSTGRNPPPPQVISPRTPATKYEQTKR